MVERLEIMVEEPSMEALLRTFLPKILGSVAFEIYAHQCKTELLQSLPKRLSGYARWLPQDHRLLILVDRDERDCREFKAELEQIAAKAKLISRSTGNRPYQIVNRIAVEELEAWYFGDWEAVKLAFPRVPATIPRQERYRNPDAISGGTWESFERVMQRAGYYRAGLLKIEAARKIGPHLDPRRSRSPSFRCLCNVLEEIASEAESSS